MKTLRYKEIDGYNVVIGITDAETMIDYEATRQIVAKKIVDTDVSKNIEAIKSKMINVAYQQTQAKQAVKNSKTKEERQVHWDELKKREDEFKALEKEMLPLANQLKKEYSEMILNNAVYFPLREIEGQGEIFVDDLNAETIADLMRDNINSVIDIDGNIIANYVGRVYWTKSGDTWTRQEITKLGVGPVSGGILERDLSDVQRSEIAEQLEIERVAKLTNAQKATESAQAIESAAAQADVMRGKLIIQGVKDADALSQAQAWYNEQVAVIEEKYK